jgi:CheY-like chemotaxis protein
VLVIGRSQAVLDGTVELLSEAGYPVQATNDFEAITDQVDPQTIDLVVLGGQIPPAKKVEMREHISAANDAVSFVQGLAGIPGLITDQVAGALAGEQLIAGQAPVYDAAEKKIALSLYASMDVKVTVYWITALIPPDPKSDSLVLHDGPLPSGDHAFEIPSTVSLDAAFATVSAGTAIWSFRLDH